MASLAAIVTVSPGAMAQVTFEVAPYAGLYLPLGSMLLPRPPAQAIYGHSGPVNSIAQVKTVALGAHVTAWLAPRLGIEGTFSYAPSGITYTCRNNNCTDGHVMTGSMKVLVPLTVVPSLPPLRVGGGIAVVNHGGPAYDYVAGTTSVAGTVSIGTTVKAGGSGYLRIDAQDFLFRPHLSLSDNGYCHATNNGVCAAILTQQPIPGFQHDVIISIGLAFRDWSRTPKERAPRPGSDSITPSPPQLPTARFGVAAGVTLPVGDYHAAGFGAGWQGMALVAFRIGRSPLGFRADGNYSTSTSHQPFLGSPNEERIEFLGADADLTLMDQSSRRVKPYVLAGPGVYRVSDAVSELYYGGHSASTGFAWNFGGGLTAGRLFVEARSVHTSGFGGRFPAWAFLSIAAGSRFVGL